MTAAIVDTNVLVVANGRNAQANAEPTGACRLAAIDALTDIKARHTLLLDAGGGILDEYRRHCNYSGQPGVGDQFFRWAHQNAPMLGDVSLTPHSDRRYDEFPSDQALVSFDYDDRVFVAVAIAGPKPNRILNAVDSDYSRHLAALSNSGITVAELCPGLLVGP